MIFNDLVSLRGLLTVHGLLKLAALRWLPNHLLELLVHEQHAVLQIFHVHGFCAHFVLLGLVLNATLLPQVSQ